MYFGLEEIKNTIYNRVHESSVCGIQLPTGCKNYTHRTIYRSNAINLETHVLHACWYGTMVDVNKHPKV